jgi:DNA-binding transcriptional LysR family regulator
MKRISVRNCGCCGVQTNVGARYPLRMDYRRLRYFLVLAEELHFGRAAARLNMAQPPLSQQIRKLENELGVELLHRERGRPVELTDAGQALLHEGRRALVQAERAASAAQRAGRGEVGHLRVGFAPSAAIDVLPNIVRAFTARFSAIGLSLIELESEKQAAELRVSELDVGLIRPPVEETGLVSELISEEPLVVVLPEGHPLAVCDVVEIADLSSESFVMSPRGVAPGWYDEILALCRGHGFSPQIVQEVTTIQARMGLVAAGVGISLLPGSIRSLHRAGVVVIPVNAPPVELRLAWREESRSSILDSFLSCARGVGLAHKSKSPDSGAGASSA